MIKSNLSQNLFGSCLLLKSSIWSIYGNKIRKKKKKMKEIKKSLNCI